MMQRPSYRLAASLLMAVAPLAFSTRASAQKAPSTPASFDAQGYSPTPAGDRFFAVQEARVHGLLDYNLEMTFDKSWSPTRYMDTKPKLISSQWFSHLNLSLEADERLQLNVDLPVAISQNGDEGFSVSPSAGLGDLRLSLRATVFKMPEHVLDVAVQSAFWLPTAGEHTYAGDPKARANPAITAGGNTLHFAYAANVGFLFRHHRDFGNPEIGDAITFGAAFGALMLDQRLQIGPEIYGNTVIAQDGSSSPFLGEHSSPVEALMGAKLRFGNWVFGTAVARGITKAPGTPAMRFIASISLVQDDREVDWDGDGVLDEQDRCPHDPGFRGDGCPRPDRDHDTIADQDDACPLQQGLVSADPQQNGCPPPGNQPLPQEP